jgi:hypothetical protein
MHFLRDDSWERFLDFVSSKSSKVLLREGRRKKKEIEVIVAEKDFRNLL